MKQRKTVKKEYIWMLLVSIAAIFLRYMFIDVMSDDMRANLVPWYQELSKLSFRDALRVQVGKYSMLNQLLMYILTFFPGEPLLKYKLISCVFDFILAFSVYFFVKKTADSLKAVLLYAATLFLPTVWLNSAAWGQCDSIYASLLVMSLLFLYSEKTTGSVILLGAALAFKAEAAFMLPFFIFVYGYGLLKKQPRLQLFHLAMVPVTVIWTAAPNILAGRPVTDLVAVYLRQIKRYREISMDYPGIWNLMKLSYDSDRWWCMGFTVLMLCGLMIWLYKRNVDIYGRHFLWCAFLLSYTCVLFLPGMRERYGFIYEILAVMLSLVTGAGWCAVIFTQLLSMKTYFNYLYYVPLNMGFLSLINTALYIFMIYAFYRELSGKPIKCTLFIREKELEPADEVKAEKPCSKDGRIDVKDGIIKEERVSLYDKKVICILTLIFLFIGSLHLGQMKAPETAIEAGTEAGKVNEVYVPFDSQQDVESVCIYPILSKNIDFDIFYSDKGEWKKIEGDVSYKGVFTWKQMDMDVNTDSICVKFKDPKAQIAEIVCFGSEGKQIPVSGEAIPKELFDEQDCLKGLPTAYESMMFDEVFHGRTAYEFIHGLDIYEDTHPPLGKTIISLGIRLFGMNPFGYRIMSLLFGAMCIPVVYLFGLRITGKSLYGLLAAVLQMTEFMHYTLSRIATVDIFVAFFVLVMFYGVLAFLQEEKEKYLILSGTAFSLGAATKWTAVYAAAGIAVILFAWMICKLRNLRSGKAFDKSRGIAHEKKSYEKVKAEYKKIVRFVIICISVYIILPTITYVLSYIPFIRVYPEKNLLQHAVSNSIYMFKYHSGLNEPHAYESSWYTWLFDWVPLVDFRAYIGEYKSSIATFVNPFICYAGLAAAVYHAFLCYKRRDKTAAILLVFYLCMLLPWVFITRTVFIYQYFICTKILILMICYSIYKLRFIKEKKAVAVTAGISGTLFLAYLPVLTGILVKTGYINEILKVLPKWWF